MKLQSIALTNFLSHSSTSWELNGARLASIVGPNGAGKSGLLEAILYALFDSARARADQLVRLGQTDMSAVVTFDFAGATYRVTRGRTTKGAGRSYLELAIRNGDAWTPLTGEDIRTTQATIEQLLGLDAATFTTAAFLRQGEADAFVTTTAAERKRILVQVLGLDVYERAEARAREYARDLEARTAADRAQAERLEAEVEAERDRLVALRAEGSGRLKDAVDAIAESTAERDRLDKRLHELDVALASADAIVAQVDQLEREKAAAGETWRRARDRQAAAKVEIARLEALLAGADDVAAAAADLPAARARVDELVAGEAEERRLSAEIQTAHRAILDLERPYEAAVTTWRVQHDAAVARVTELEAHAKAGTMTCTACGQPIGQDTAREQLTAARAARDALGEQPKAPISIARAEATKARLETRYVELGWDPAVLIAARDALTTLERVAARAETIAAARTSIEREQAAVTEAAAEQSAIAEKGQAAALKIVELQGQVDEAKGFRAERDATVPIRDEAKRDLERSEGIRTSLDRTLAHMDAQLEALEKSAAAAAEIRTRLEADDVEAGRLRRLVQAFGVTGIPARIIEGVLPELASYANDLLAELRPGMTLELRAQRAKKDGKGTVEALDLVVRDPVGERPLALFSGGERMSVSLALAVALSRLVARRAGARIESLVVDEPDGLDREARRSFGQALRAIAHRGELARVVLVSHHDDLAEFGDEVYQVSKGPNGSVVELVA